MLKKVLLIMLMLSISTSVLANIGIINIVEVHAVPYDITIRAHCYLEDTPITVAITKDGSPSGFSTPYTFQGLTGTHTFAVPATDGNGDSFTRWSTGEATMTITVTEAGGSRTLVAYYYHYYANIQARDTTLDTWESVAITMDGSPTGFTTPHNFTQITGPHTFFVPDVSPDNHPLSYYSWAESGVINSQTLSVDGLIDGNGNQTVQYAAYTFDARFRNGTAVSVGVTRVGDPTVYTTPKTFYNIAGPQTFNVSSTTPTGIPFVQWDSPYNEVSDPILSVNRGLTYTAIYDAYNVTIYAYSRTMGSFVAVNVKVDNDPTWYTTPHNFAGLSGTRSFMVWPTDPNGNPFAQWDFGGTGTTLNVVPWLRRPSYTAYYEAISIKAFSYVSGAPISVPIYKNGTPTGFDTPHTFLGLLPPWNFTVPLLDADGHPFQWWSDGALETTRTVTNGGNYTALYRLPPVVYIDPPYIQGARDTTVTAYVKIYNLTDGWVWNPARNPPLYEPLGNLYSISMKMSWDASALEYMSRSVRMPVDGTVPSYPDGILHGPISASKDAPSKDDYVSALAISGSYLYAGGSLAPGKVVKIDLANWTPMATLTLASGENTVNALVVDGSYLYAGLGTTPGKIVKIDLATFTKVGTLTLGNGENDIRALAVASGFLYAGEYTIPGNVTKVNLATFTKVSTLKLPTNENRVTALAVSGTDLYAGLYTTTTASTKVVKISLTTFTRTSGLPFNAGENQVTSLAVSGTNLYAGLYNSTTGGPRVVRVALGTFTRTGVLPFSANENNVNALAVSGTDLYAGCYVSPGRVVKVNLGTFTRTTALTLPSGEPNIKALAVTGTDLYAGEYIIPMKVAKIALASFTYTSTLVRYLPPYELTAQSIFNTALGVWPLPFNNDSLTNHPTVYQITFKILKANTRITLTLSEILLQTPPAGYQNSTGGQPFSRPDITNILMYSRAFDLNDLAALQAAYGATPVSINWNLSYDFNRDNIIGAEDLRLLGKCFGKRI